MTGELSIPGKVRAVGGVVEKLYAARQAGMRRVLIPKENAREVDAALGGHRRDPGDERRAGPAQNSVCTGQVHTGARTRAMHKRRKALPDAEPRRMSAQPLPGPIDRIPPNNLEAEMALIGSVLVDREMMGDRRRDRAPVGFLRARARDDLCRAHRSVRPRRAARQNHGRRRAAAARRARARRRPLVPERADGYRADGRLGDRTTRRIVREKSILRSLIHAGTQITQLGYEGRRRRRRGARPSEQLVYAIGERRASSEFMPVSRLMKDAFDHIDHLFHLRGDRTGLTSGFRDIDEMTTGFQPGNFVIVAGAAGHGQDVVRAEHGSRRGARIAKSRSRSSRSKCRTTNCCSA